MKAKDEMNDLEKMLDQVEEHLDENIPQNSQYLELNQEPAFEIDYEKIQKKCNNQAKKMLKNITGLMMGDELIKNNPYLKSKLETDIISLGGMLYQIEINKSMQKALSEEIRHGSMSPRMFEAYTGLSKHISEDNKQLLQTVEAIKVTYQDLKEMLESFDEITATKQIGGLVETDQGLISIGSKDLIKQANKRKIDKFKKSNNIEDAKEVK